MSGLSLSMLATWTERGPAEAVLEWLVQWPGGLVAVPISRRWEARILLIRSYGGCERKDVPRYV